MRAFRIALFAVFFVALGGVGGFFAASDFLPQWRAFAARASEGEAPAASAERRILYYRNPMGLPDTSPVPKKDSMGMDYIPVYEDEAPATSAERKILYYRNPMGLPDTSPVPKKDSMGMDYIPVYADEEARDPGVIKISVEKVQRAGVRTETVEMRQLSEPIQVPGSIQLDERRERSITLRAEAYIEQVYAGATGQFVRAGEPLFRFYSPQITQAIVDYQIAIAGGQKEAGATKLRNLGLPDEFIRSLPAKGTIPLSHDWPSPVDGVLMSKSAVAGARAMPGEELYRLSDVSTVWVIAEVPEAEIGRIRIGDPAEISIRAFPEEKFRGSVAFVLPELRAETRTAQVRIELANPGHRLLHRMYADVTIDTGGKDEAVAIPASSVIDSGKRQVAILALGEGRFKPVPVTLGRKGADHVEVLEGLQPGDNVVTRANFLIDAESNLQAALGALTSAEGSDR
jgi:Cu(I)/Ag(I) efflux system membrane fusion protein